jgi:signal transduction histidine kinase
MPDEPLEILVVDDSPEDRAAYRRYLSRDTAQTYRIYEEAGVDAGLAALATVEPACIILDYAMPDGTGLEFLWEVHKAERTRAIPVIMLTGTGDESIAVQAMKAGARDYLVKGQLTPESLRIAISGAIYRAQAERQLDAQRVELERLYRAAQEANREKDALVSQLQEANSAKDQFLATLSHELRTPLTPILIAVSSIDEAQLNGEVRDLFETIRRNVELEARLIDDLLDLTRVSKGKLQLDLQPTDVHTILQSVVEICRADLESKSFILELNFAATSRFVHGDGARLQQVFWNLLKNAAKFTPMGGRITVSTHTPAPDRIRSRSRTTASAFRRIGCSKFSMPSNRAAPQSRNVSEVSALVSQSPRQWSMHTVARSPRAAPASAKAPRLPSSWPRLRRLQCRRFRLRAATDLIRRTC